MIEKRLIGHVKIHAIGLHEAEEDEWIMLHVFSSQLVLLLFPLGLRVESLGRVISFDKCAAPVFAFQDRLLIMNYYRDCVKRHLFAHGRRGGGRRRFLSKNPPFTMRLETLRRVFPDLKVACLIRDPVESVPSMVSYISLVWAAASSPRQVYPNTRELVGFCQLHYLYPLEIFRSGLLRDNQWVFVSYSSMIRSLTPTVTTALERLGLRLGLDGLEREEQAMKSYRSSHVYSARICCGLSEDQIRELMAPVYEAHASILVPSFPRVSEDIVT